MMSDPKNIALVSIESVPDGMRPLGVVRGSTARSRNIARDITAGLKNLVGGEVTSYTKLMADAREEAIYRMQEDAARMGATMVVGVRFASAMVSQGVSIDMWMLIIVGLLCIPVIYKRFGEKKTERFEDRDN